MRFSSLVDRIGGRRAAAWQIHFAASAAFARGEDVIVLSLGDPDFDSPAAATEAAIHALRTGDTHYSSIVGRDALRQAIVDDFRLVNEQAASLQHLTVSNVAVVGGTQGGLFASAMCLLEPGDEAITFEPMYVTYEACMRASGATLVTVPLKPEDDFRVDAQALAAAITPRTRAIFLATPANPTGRVMRLEELEAIAELARRHDLWVVADEVYASLAFEQQHISIATLPGMAERTATISSVSKSHAMTGWRLGWVIAPAEMVSHLANLGLCVQYGTPGFVQEGALAALTKGRDDCLRMRDTYLRRRNIVAEQLANVPGLRCLTPEAGMFTLLDIRETGLSSHDFAWRLYRETGVSVLDGGAFGAPLEGFLRMSFVVGDDVLVRGCERIARFMQTLMSAQAAPAAGVDVQVAVA